MQERKIRCDVYSRVVGYFSPVSNWNQGKKEEFRQRKYLKINDINFINHEQKSE